MFESLPVLYSFRRCPYAMRARLALAASGMVCELREVVLTHKPPALLQASPKGTVPVLVLPGGQVLEQSLDIMLWALQQNDPLDWLGKEGALERMVELVTQCDGPFKFHLDRYKYPGRYGLSDGLEHRAAGAAFLEQLNAQLGPHPYLRGAHACLADAAIAPFVRQFAHTDPAWFTTQPWPALQGWLHAFEASAAFQQVMHKYPPWVPGQPVVLFPADEPAMN